MKHGGRGGAGGRGLPTWLLILLVLGALGGAAALFLAGDGGGDGGSGPRAGRDGGSEPDREQAEGVLSLPDEDDSSDTRRRGSDGRDRLEADESDASPDPGDGATDPADTPPTDDLDTRPLPPAFRRLAGTRVALLPASATLTSGDAERIVAIGGLRIACAGAASPARLVFELAVRERMQRVLERAGAIVVATADEAGAAGCTDARVRSQERADAAVVLGARTESGAAARVFAGRPATDADAASKRASRTLAAELAGALDDAEVVTASRADERRLAQVAAIDLSGGAAVAFVELDPATGRDADALDDTAFTLVRGLAAMAARAAEPAAR